jgi:hypothetical protein
MKRGNAKLAATLSAAILLLSACRPVQAPPGGSADAPATSAAIPVVTLKVTEAGLEAPGEIPSGVVAVAVEGAIPRTCPNSPA